MRKFILSGEMASGAAADHFAGWVGGRASPTRFGSWEVVGEGLLPKEALSWCESRGMDVNGFEPSFPRSLVFDSGVVLSCFDDDFGLWNLMGLRSVLTGLEKTDAYGELEVLDDPKKAEKTGLVSVQKNNCPTPGSCALITTHRVEAGADFENVFLFSRQSGIERFRSFVGSTGNVFVFKHSSIGVIRDFIR